MTVLYMLLAVVTIQGAPVAHVTMTELWPSLAECRAMGTKLEGLVERLGVTATTVCVQHAVKLDPPPALPIPPIPPTPPVTP